MELRAENISKQFYRKTGSANYFYAVKETSFTLSVGKITALTGRSGSGKSTFLNMLAGLLTPSGGRVILKGDEQKETDLYALSDKELSRVRNRYLGVIPQGQTGLANLNVIENIKMPYLLYGEKDSEELSAYANELIRKVGIEDLKDAWPSELSGGEMRRMSIARSLIMKPGIILADEPTGDLDDENTEAVLRILRGVADEGAAVLLVTHERDAVKYADEEYRMDAGTLSVV